MNKPSATQDHLMQCESSDLRLALSSTVNKHEIRTEEQKYREQEEYDKLLAEQKQRDREASAQVNLQTISVSNIMQGPNIIPTEQQI